MEARTLKGPPAERPLKRIAMDNWISVRSPSAARVPATSHQASGWLAPYSPHGKRCRQLAGGPTPSNYYYYYYYYYY